MPTPSKPVTVLMSEGKSHRTKKELQQRKDGEDSLATGVSLKMRSEVKANPIAKKEFTRVSSLLKKIGKNDALVEGGINRYCSLTAEIREFEDKREVFYKNIQDLQSAYDEDKENHSIDDRVIPALDYFKTLAQMESAVINLDKQIMSKRKMLLDIEKENIMTIAAQLRSIPKKVDGEDEEDDMAQLFSQNMKTRGA
ncbi:MAG: hypothetical protein ACI4KF_12155 [Huintestinicola sp.]